MFMTKLEKKENSLRFFSSGPKMSIMFCVAWRLAPHEVFEAMTYFFECLRLFWAKQMVGHSTFIFLHSFFLSKAKMSYSFSQKDTTRSVGVTKRMN